jgi:hypothetical protein
MVSITGLNKLPRVDLFQRQTLIDWRRMLTPIVARLVGDSGRLLGTDPTQSDRLASTHANTAIPAIARHGNFERTSYQAPQPAGQTPRYPFPRIIAAHSVLCAAYSVAVRDFIRWPEVPLCHQRSVAGKCGHHLLRKQVQ